MLPKVPLSHSSFSFSSSGKVENYEISIDKNEDELDIE